MINLAELERDEFYYIEWRDREPKHPLANYWDSALSALDGDPLARYETLESIQRFKAELELRNGHKYEYRIQHRQIWYNDKVET